MAGLNLNQMRLGLGIPTTSAPGGTPGFNPSAQQTSVDYSLPSNSLKIGEAAQKLSSSNTYGDFSSLTQNYGIQGDDLVDSGTKQLIAALGDTPAPAPAGSTVAIEPLETNDVKVIIKQEPKTDDVEFDVVFDIMPTIQESRSASYTPMDIVHHPGEILKYKNTAARSWSVSGRLISRTVEEATKNRKIINMIRAWLMPFYGEGTNKSDAAYLGAPPPILTLSAYGVAVIGPVKCVLESYDWTWPNDVDYIPATGLDGKTIAWPVIIDVSLSLKESWSPAEYSGFSLRDYRLGKLPDAFKSIAPSKNQATDTSSTEGVGGDY